MSKSSKPAIDWRMKSWQALPYTLLGTILFAWGSSMDLNPYVSGYIVLLVAQLGTVGIYLLINRARKHQNRQDR
jgi:hypothetical protein